jgi:ribosome biogenesis GTPase
VIHCAVRGRLKKERKARTDLCVIGDRVNVSMRDGEAGEGVIESVEPRDNRFARRQPGGRGRYKEDVLVANLDWLIAVFACESPPPNPRLIDRFLVVAELDDLNAAIVANKVDRVGEDAAREIFSVYASLGYRVFYTSAKLGDGVDALRELVTGQVSAFVGPSGVGKSSLLNALDPGLGAAVGEVSETLDKGRHTTRVAELHPLRGGGWVADTPGIRELASFELPKDELARCFPEMAPHLGSCRFPDCSHDHEPGCAIREAVARSEIRLPRYESYLRILAGDER